MSDENARNELLELGSRSVPTIVINEEVIIGFNKTKIDEALNK